MWGGEVRLEIEHRGVGECVDGLGYGRDRYGCRWGGP